VDAKFNQNIPKKLHLYSRSPLVSNRRLWTYFLPSDKN